MALEFDISYVINAYLNAYVKASEISAPPGYRGENPIVVTVHH